jgi:ApbE superfamily uncharacterized protein (UPF0280 family)
MEPRRLSAASQACVLPSGARAARLADGRLHLRHGPIDILIEAFGAASAIEVAYAAAITRFSTILDELVGELGLLRAPLGRPPPVAEGAVARRMVAACVPHAGVFVTPMAAVAGAVADEVLAAMLAPGQGLARAYVNNGGDIALYLAPGEALTAGLVADIDDPEIAATAAIEAAMPVRGVATSGRGGRSFSFGIADAVTVLAAAGASADVAATLIANRVNIDSPAVVRRPARELQEDSDLGVLPVVVALGPLPLHDVASALDAGLAEAERMRAAGLIAGAYLVLRGQSRATGLAIPSLSGSSRPPAPRVPPSSASGRGSG